MKKHMLILILTCMFIALVTAIAFPEIIVNTVDGRSISVPVHPSQIRSIEFSGGRHAELPPPYSDRRPESFRVFNAVPQQSTSAFRQKPERSLSIDTANFDRTPSYITYPVELDISLEPGQRCYLAGDPDGRANWAVDNFILFEVATGRETRRFIIGEAEPVFYRGQRIEQIGPDTTVFSPGAIDLCAYMPKGVDFKLRISAFDYGGSGYVSNLFLIIQ